MHDHYIRGIYDTKEIINFKWKLQLLHAWLSTSKQTYLISKL